MAEPAPAAPDITTVHALLDTTVPNANNMTGVRHSDRTRAKMEAPAITTPLELNALALHLSAVAAVVLLH